MRRLLVIACVVSSSTAFGDMIQFDFPIDTFQELPAPTIPVGVPVPSGSGTVLLDTVANTIDWSIDYQDLTGQIVAPGAHFHGAAMVGQVAGIQIDIAGNAAGTGTGVPLPQPASGNLSGSASITDIQEADIIAGLWYVNIHTGLNQAGEIRGQVVPEPTTLALLAAFGVVAFRRRSRSRRPSR